MIVITSALPREGLKMDVTKMLEQLRQERDRIESVMAVLATIGDKEKKKRGRPKGSKRKPLQAAAGFGGGVSAAGA